MRKILGPLVLVATALASLIWVQHNNDNTHFAAPTSSSSRSSGPQPSSTMPISTATVTQPRYAPAPSLRSVSPGGPGGANVGTPAGSLPVAGATAVPQRPSQAQRWRAAQVRATGFVAAFARSTQDPHVWWAGVKSFLSPQAAADYEGVDPTAVPYTKIIGPAVVVPLEGPTDLITAVQIPTDAGIYMVYLETT